MSSIASLTSLNAGAPASTASTTSSSSSGVLGQADFMKLLIAQMKNQNPLDPQSSTDFATQLAQFSSLNGINQLNQNFTNMLMLQGLSQGTNLIGKTVVYNKDTAGNTAKGTVSSVNVNNGAIQLVIGSANVSLSQIKTVSQT